MQMDVSDLSSLQEKVTQIEQIFGHIDILINNAGISVRADVASMAVDLDVQVMLVNYFGTVAMTKGSYYRHFYIQLKQKKQQQTLIIICDLLQRFYQK